MTANELVENAKELLGIRYVWGGSTPTQGLTVPDFFIISRRKQGQMLVD